MQSIAGIGLGATGIVGTLIVAGIILKVTGVAVSAGAIAIGAGVFIGIVLGALGIIGVISRLV